MMFYEIPADYRGLLPPHWHDFLEIHVLDEIINGQVNALHETIKRGVDNKSVAHADLVGIERWEKILGLSSPLNSTLEARRDAVRAKLMTKPPINLGTLYSIIETYLGVPVEISIKDYVVTVKYRGVIKIQDLSPLFKNIYETIPANLLFTIIYRYVTWGEVKEGYANWDKVKQHSWEFIRMGE